MKEFAEQAGEVKPGLLFVIAAPSGAGKTSLVNALLAADEQLKVCVSHTTRDRRAGENDGVEYHFIDRRTFESMIEQGEFVEHAEVFGHLYGTAKPSLAQQRAAGHDVVLEIDWQGAAQVRAEFDDLISIFVLPPSRATLLERLQSRGKDSAEVIANRTALARTEIAQHTEFDYLVVNEDFELATQQLQSIVTAARLRHAQASVEHANLLHDLLE